MNFDNVFSGLTRAFDRLLPKYMSIEGSRHYRRELLPANLTPGLKVIDVGSGRYPQISPEVKARLALTVIGLDLSGEELAKAPAGAYDQAIAADATTFAGDGDADLVISHCCFEHLPDTAGGFRALASMLKPGGRAVIYNPSRAALFAKINLMIPEGLKRRALGMLPDGGGHGGWPAVYDRATPDQFAALATAAGLEVEAIHRYWISGYFLPMPPVHILWRAWQAGHRLIAGDEAAESFTTIVRKPACLSHLPSDAQSQARVTM